MSLPNYTDSNNNIYAELDNNTYMLIHLSDTFSLTNVVLDQVNGKKIVAIADNVFNPSIITSITALNVKTIGSSAFYGCNSLTTVNMPKLVSIGNNAFFDCTSLVTVDIPNVEKIGFSAFSQSGITNMDLPNVIHIESDAFNSCGQLNDIYMPNVEILGDKTFLECVKLVNVYAPKCISIGLNTFNSCLVLKCVYLPKITVIPHLAFNLCGEVIKICCSKVVSIESGAFKDCGSLRTLDVPLVSSIFDNAFENSGITSLDLPNVVFIGANAFNSCTLLYEINMPHIENIGSQAFFQTALLSVHLPKTIKYIGDNAFSTINNLQTVYFDGCINSIVIGCQAFNNPYDLVNTSINYNINVVYVKDLKCINKLVEKFELPSNVFKIRCHKESNCYNEKYICRKLEDITVNCNNNNYLKKKSRNDDEYVDGYFKKKSKSNSKKLPASMYVNMVEGGERNEIETIKEPINNIFLDLNKKYVKKQSNKKYKSIYVKNSYNIVPIKSIDNLQTKYRIRKNDIINNSKHISELERKYSN
jgi:hypothetical protein